MRVLHIYSGNLYGGIETLLVTLASSRKLCPEMELEFCLCFDGRLNQELSAAAPTHLLNPVRLRKPWTALSARRKLAQLLSTRNFDIVVCHSAWCQSIFGSIVKKAGIPLVFSLHDSTDGRFWLERLAKKVKPDMVLTNSFFTTATAAQYYPDVLTKVLYWPVAAPEPVTPAERTNVRTSLGVSESDTVIIQVSRLEEWKGHLLHLEALSKLRDKAGWVCWMVGGAQRPHEQAYFSRLQLRAQDLGISDRIRFLGQRTDVQNLLAAADIHCQPNTGPEPFGRTFIEALNAGLPVVTTKMGAAVEIVDNSCGILVEPQNADQLAEALSGLIDHPQTRHQFRHHSLARAKSLCDPATQMHRFADTLSEVLPVAHLN